MDDNFKLVANPRESFGKGAARKLRATGQTPAVVYGHGTAARHISVDAHALSLIVRWSNSIIELKIDGKKQIVLVRDVQREVVRRYVEHVDLVIIKKGETVLVDVPVTVVGEPFSGSVYLLELTTLSLTVPAISIPDLIEIDVEGLVTGTQIQIKDIELPEGAIADHEPEELVVNIVDMRVEEEPETIEVAPVEEEPAE